MKKSMFIYLFLWMSGILIAPVAQANTNQALVELLKALEENGTISKDVYELVLKVADQEKTAEVTVVAKEDVKKIVQEEIKVATKDQPKIKMKDTFAVESGDGDFSLRVGGRIQTDAGSG
jgi:DNA-directed RNA polymerase subunit H (RpoH/RPB5)